MTQEEKELLHKDLTARLPYGVIVKYWSREGDGDVKLGCGNIGYVLQVGNGWWKECKPYLRPMSSMTDEEREEFRKAGGVMSYSPQHDTWAISAFAPEAYDWLNKNKFDYRGLIPMGLALEAPEDMYKINTK